MRKARNVMLSKLLPRRTVLIVYLVVGLIVATSHHYFAHLDGAKAVLSAVLAVALWPLLLFGISLHIK
jgi:Mn2+/Fe2+ NRAMP family transporter